MNPTSSPSAVPSYRSDLWRLVVGIGVLIFALLGWRPLMNPDEGRYTEIPREMAATGDYVTPRLNGVKYFEKPPLQYWLSAATFEVFGFNEFTARFWCGAFALGGALLTYAAGRAFYGRETGLAAAVVLATSLLYNGLSRVVLLDLIVSVLVAAALFAFLAAVRESAGTKRRWLFWAFYAAMALATLAKGLIGFALPCAVAGLWVLGLNRWGRLRPFHPFSGTLLFLAIAAPWHVFAARANGDFLYFYFVHEHYLRFTTQVHERVEPWWYFGPVLLIGLFPWVVFLFQSLRHNLRDGWRARSANDVAWFLLIWIGFIVLFFSKSQSKLVPYILPVFPAAAVLIGRYLAGAWGQSKATIGRGGLGVAAGLFLAMALAVSVFPVRNDPTLAAELRPWRWALAGWLVLSGGAIAWLVARRGVRSGLVALVFGMAGLLVLSDPVIALADRRSTKPLALQLKAQAAPDEEVFSYRDYFQDLPVYLGHTVSVVGYEGELAFGIHAEPEKTAARFVDEAEFLRRWALPGRRYAVARRRDIAGLLAQPAFPHAVLGEYRGRVLLTNRPR